MPPPKNPVVFPPKQAGRRAGRRGFTLVEIALAMAVIGLLLGASAWMARALDERRQLQREMQRLEIVRDAIVGYAIRNRTRERVLKVVPQFGPAGDWSFRLPAGRPYLPCPDWDGNGYEDRMPEGAFAQGMEVKPDLTVTVTVAELAPPWNGWLTWTRNLGSSSAAYPYGECRVSRGGVPWRTLGVAPSDGWGNRHTYFADPVFSNAIFGFDRQTVADIYDPRVPSAPGYGPSLRLHKFVYGDFFPPSLTPPAPADLQQSIEEGDGHNASCPAAICIGTRACEPSRESPPPGDASRCAWRNPGADQGKVTVVFKAGLVTSEPIDDGRKHYPAGSVVDGLPFVLVSHGPNGRYAPNHWATLQNRTRGFGDYLFPICNRAWQTTGFFPGSSYISEEDIVQHFETANAVRDTPAARAGTSCIRINGFLGGDDIFDDGTAYNTASFVWQPPGIGDKSDFDDLLVWKTRGELTAAIHGRIPRLPHMAIPYFPE